MRATQAWWRPTGTLGRLLTALFVAQAGLLLLSAVADDMTGWLRRLGNAFDALRQGHDTVAQNRLDHITTPGFFQLSGFVSTAALVLIVIWQWRSVKNAEALGRVGARLSSGWAIAGWLIPLVNFVVPYLVMQDLWRSTDERAAPGTAWRDLPGAPLVTQWWVAYVVSIIAIPLALGLVVAGSQTAGQVSWLLTAGELVGAGASVLGAFVVREITSRQARQQELTPAPTSQPVLTAGGLAPSGWYADPRGRFDWRYWNGHAWTEWAATDGNTEIDPV
jgi:hypothetical protein